MNRTALLLASLLIVLTAEAADQLKAPVEAERRSQSPEP